jgi:hypothetical protein
MDKKRQDTEGVDFFKHLLLYFSDKQYQVGF